MSIKFTANWSIEEVTFLDTRVYLKNNCLETDLHTKPTDNISIYTRIVAIRDIVKLLSHTVKPLEFVESALNKKIY